MKTLEKIIILAGLGTLAFLLWKFDPRSVWAQVSGVGAGFLIILPLQFIDHAFNAMGWRFAFGAQDARRVPFLRLLLVRVAGDGVNYLTVSGTVAGELVRPGMLGGYVPEDVRNSSVLVAKLTQSLGQALFILLGLAFILKGSLNVLAGPQRTAAVGGVVVITLFVTLLLVALSARRGGVYFWRLDGWIGALREQLYRYLRAHPGRFILSVVFFALGYASGAIEVFVICFFLGVPVVPLTAVAIEVLSNIIDSMTFMVPAKLGTQEAGKTAIFAALGLPAMKGLAFGFVRHTRELIWAGSGFLWYALHTRRKKGALKPACAGIDGLLTGHEEPL